MTSASPVRSVRDFTRDFSSLIAEKKTRVVNGNSQFFGTPDTPVVAMNNMNLQIRGSRSIN